MIPVPYYYFMCVYIWCCSVPPPPSVWAVCSECVWMIDSRLDLLIGWRCLIAAPGLDRGGRGALFEPPAGCSLPLQAFTHIQLGPVSSLSGSWVHVNHRHTLVFIKWDTPNGLNTRRLLWHPWIPGTVWHTCSGPANMLVVSDVHWWGQVHPASE